MDLALESPTIDSSFLTKFWKICTTEDILEEMLKETVQQALDKRLVKSGMILRKTFCGRKFVAYSSFIAPDTGELFVAKPDWCNYETTIESIREFIASFCLEMDKRIYLLKKI